MHQHVVRLITDFSPGIASKEKALEIFAHRAFVSSVVLHKRYAVRLLANRQVSVLRLDMCAPLVLLLLPVKLVQPLRLIVRTIKMKLSKVGFSDGVKG